MKLSFLSILGLIFVTLKLIGTITWSWWWVLLPFYGGALIVLVALIGFLLTLAVVSK